LEKVVERDAVRDETLKSDTLKSSSKPLSACDVVPEFSPKLFGDEFVEQKLSIDTESLPPVFYLLMKPTGDTGGDSSKFMSCAAVTVDDNVVKF
jgi:hypothetical protein